jgi:chemotaxis response regulator CheB
VQHLQKLRILIVEDDPMMRVGLKYMLSAQPQLEIIGIAEDGYLGVEAVKTQNPDVVVMDVVSCKYKSQSIEANYNDTI